MRVTLIHNPKAGGGTGPEGDALAHRVRAAGHTATYQSSKEKDWVAALDEPADLVAVAGGDGTVARVARHLVGRAVPLAVLPLGTANNIATTLGLVDAPLDRLIAGWETARRMNLDVGVARGPWGEMPFIEGFGVGLLAGTLVRLEDDGSPESAHVDNGDDELESAHEVLLGRLRRSPAKRFSVWLDGQDLSGQYALIEAMNIRHVGPNLHLAPEADPGDGLLDVVLLPHDEPDALTEYLSHGPDGGLRPAGLPVHRGRHLRLDWDGFAVHIDDQPWPTERQKPPAAPARIDVTLSSTQTFLLPE